MKNMKDNPQLKPTTPDRSYLRKFIEKFKTHQNGKERKILIERETLPYLIILSLLNAFLLHDFKSGISSFFGSFIVIFLLLIFFYRDLKRYKPAYLKKKKMMALLASLIVFTLIISRGFEHIFLVFSKGLGVESIVMHTFGIPLALGPVIVVLIFDFHTAITFSLILSLMAGIWLKTSLIPLYVFIGCLIGAFSLLKCKKRTDIINAGIYIALANIFSSSAILLIMGFFDLHSLYFAVVFSVINGFTVSALCFLCLPAIERLFNVTTPVSLVELLDIDHPLMKQLSVEAPGTYHHSMIVGSLAEAASEVVGVNPLLAKVASYYHDIGKIRMPEYFVENQTGCISKHEKLNPHLSSMIIIAHVKDGVELAEEFNLPEIVKDVIQQHHGTTLVTYFYQKALKEMETPPSEQDYRYPGPKPQTKLAALIMLADAVEAASRTLDDPTPARISGLVDKIIKNIFLDGQLDECEITLKDLSEIKKKFEYILAGIFHRRISYPEPAKEKIV
ncbi:MULTISPECIES: HD family phosphohydrolase [Thermodesulfovibrio]|uniref:Metal-dependent phosphohydrolase n=1 Tax=Thermodesulfovibrio yellowstonii TaxID=28262 RepID=A0A9W6GG97_9BACT|nr:MULTISPECIES: HDIG domain-containing metalloprotein [Thermodesulfovibrio]GLI53413.1 metal-dependent phosphohydrolase [Thermodesulfovibrio islandicus]